MRVASRSDEDPHNSPFWYGKVIYTAVGLLSIMIVCFLLGMSLGPVLRALTRTSFLILIIRHQLLGSRP